MVNMELWKEDASLPAQYWDMFASGGEVAPEKRLLIAVLEEAIKSYRALAFSGGRRFAEVEEWFACDDNRYTFSFASICEVLGLSATGIRKSLRIGTATEPLRPADKTRRPERAAPHRGSEKAAAAELRA
jgi:hypothetical protein